MIIVLYLQYKGNQNLMDWNWRRLWLGSGIIVKLIRLGERNEGMRRNNRKRICCVIYVIGALLGLAGCGSMPSETVGQKGNATVFYDENVTVKETVEMKTQETETVFETGEQDAEVEVQNAAAYGNPKEVLDNITIVSNVEVIKSETDELQIDFEIENLGVCTFVAGKGKELALLKESFSDDTKIEWTAPTADGEYIFPYMRTNETGDRFLIDWEYNGYRFAIYGNAPQNTSDRDMAGKVALAIIRNLGAEEIME